MNAAVRAAAALLLAACTGAPAAGRAEAAGATLQFGGMREVMREGNVEPRVRLSDLTTTTCTIGVGALAGLQGEVTVADGEFHLARADSGTIRSVLGAADASAALLTIASPSAFESARVQGPVDEASLAACVRALVDTDFAAVELAGETDTLSLHVVRGACPHGVTTPETEPLRWTAPAGTRVRLVGFYAPDRAGTLTHHGTDFHLHAIATRPDGSAVSGHVDTFTLRDGAELRVGIATPPR